MVNKAYGCKEPNLNSKDLEKRLLLQTGKRQSLNNQESMRSFLDSEFMNEDKLLKVGRESLQNAKFSVYNKYLNILLLKTGDPYLAQCYNNYLKIKRRGKEDDKKKSFYDRM